MGFERLQVSDKKDSHDDENSAQSINVDAELSLGFESLQVSDKKDSHEENSAQSINPDAELGNEHYSNNFLHAPMDFVTPNRTEFIADID